MQVTSFLDLATPDDGVTELFAPKLCDGLAKMVEQTGDGISLLRKTLRSG